MTWIRLGLFAIEIFYHMNIFYVDFDFQIRRIILDLQTNLENNL